MSLTGIVRALVCAGATPEMILAAVEAAELECASEIDRRREQDAVRQQRRRERLRDSHVTSRDVTVSHSDTPLPPPSKKSVSPPDPLSETQPSSLTPIPPIVPPAQSEFETCWKAYPHIRGRSSKVKTKAQWSKLRPDERASLPSAIGRYAAEGREPREECGAPAMERWLRDRRFADWIDGAQIIDFRPATGPPIPEGEMTREQFEEWRKKSHA